MDDETLAPCVSKKTRGLPVEYQVGRVNSHSFRFVTGCT